MMNRIHIILIFLSAVCSVYAQPEKVSVVPAAGNEVTYFLGQFRERVQIKSGNSQVWDFSSLEVTPVSNVKYVDPSFGRFAGEFPEANAAFDASSGSGNLTYLKQGAAGLEYLGFVADDAIPVVCIYDDPWVQYRFPLSDGNEWSDNFSGSSGLFWERSAANFFHGKYTYKVIGHGTLNTPFDIYADVYLIHAMTHGKDSAIFSGKEDSVLVQEYKSEKFVWLKADEALELASTFDGKDFFIGRIGQGEEDNLRSWNAGDIHIFPDPATTNISMKIQGLRERQYELTIVNSKGEAVIRQVKELSHEEFSGDIAVGHLPPGRYVVFLKGRSESRSGGFVKM